MTSMKDYDYELLIPLQFEPYECGTEIDGEPFGREDSTVKNNDLFFVKNPTTYCETLINMFKAIVGTGIFALPAAFSQVGYVGGSIGLLFFTYIAAYCSYILVLSAHELCKRRGLTFMSYQEVAEACFHDGPSTIASYASYSKSVVTFLINLSTFGSACVYNYVIAANLKEVCNKWIGDFNIRWYLVCLILPLVILNFVKNLKWIAPLSAVSNVLVIMVILCVLSYMIQDLPPITERIPFGNLYLLPQFAGTIFFANSFITLVLPLRNEMKTPHLFTVQPLGVLTVGTILIFILYWVFAFFGFIKYGSNASDSITLNLPEHHMGAEFIQIGVALATLASTPLNFYVLFENIEKYFLPPKTSCYLLITGNIMRIAIILLSVLISCLVPNLNLLVSLLGIAANCCLSMLLPSILHLMVFEKVSIFYILLDYFIIFLSVILFISGTVTNVQDVLKFYSH